MKCDARSIETFSKKRDMKEFWLCFVPLFIAVDAIGVLPMFMTLTKDIDEKEIPNVIFQSVITAIIVAFLFLIAGRALLTLLGITVADFMIAGGILLFVISMSDIITAEKTMRQIDLESLGSVPIGVPLITGPAVLTTSIIILDGYGFVLTSAAIFINIIIAGIVFYFSKYIHRLLGKAGAKTFSKIASLLLASIAVMIIRKGVMTFLK
jgi:multiple antibiotic resistance protein